VLSRANEYFSRPQRTTKAGRAAHRYDLAILVNPEATDQPSDEKAIEKFVKAAKAVGVRADLIDKDDYGRIAEYDALFIRDTTAVNHYTYRFARRAAAEGLVVIDDPDSILKCTNKVYLAEMFARHGIASPRTMVVHEDNIDEVLVRIGLPCVLKKPDSSFSRGVVKVKTADELRARVAEFLVDSELCIAQEFVPSAFDWRVGVLDRRALFVCRYHMARGHWQIVETDGKGEQHFGKVEPIPIELAPLQLMATALRAVNQIGDGLYGVDVKQVDDKFMVIEVNDNPNIDAGCEDAILKDGLYRHIMRVFVERLDARRR
jgi:glutathione synthase/RimK-type ligase-like ATP-grasp enzyme